MVSQGLQCLKSSVSSTTNLYTQALLAYTFSLAGATDVRNILLGKLDQQAIVSGMLVLLAFAFFFFCHTAWYAELPGPGIKPPWMPGKSFLFFVMTYGLQDLSSLTRDWTQVYNSESSGSQPLDSQGSPSIFEIVKRCEKFPYSP